MDFLWRAGPHDLRCAERTHVMGIVNVTPDSFSDGGRYFDPEAAVAAGVQMAADGADLLDVGGESTRPGSDPVSVDDEQDRVVPVIKSLAAELSIPISVDTRKAEVAKAALDAGATVVNDVTAGRDPDMFAVVAEAGAGLVLMHMLGEPKTMQENPTYDDVLRDILLFFEDRIDAATGTGVEHERIAIDPGLGFGKTLQHNLTLMKEIGRFADLGRPVVVGPSRKSFIGTLTGDLPVEERLEGTAGAVAALVINGAHVVRVHDVKEMTRVVRVADAIRHA